MIISTETVPTTNAVIRPAISMYLLISALALGVQNRERS